MVQNNEHLFDHLNGALQVFDWHIDLGRQFGPCLLNILHFIDVERARVRSKLLPDLLIDLDARLGLEVLHSVAECVGVRSCRAIV